MTSLPQTHPRQARRYLQSRYAAFGVASVPLALGTGLMISDHAAGVAWALLVCGAGLLSVALTQPRRGHERSGGRDAGS